MTVALKRKSVIGAMEQAVRFDQLSDIKSLRRQFALNFIGAAVGYVVGKQFEHPVLGILGGMGVTNSIALAVDKQFEDAACTAVAEAAAISVSLWCPNYPAVGYIAGHIGGNVLMSALLYEDVKTIERAEDPKSKLDNSQRVALR